MRARLRSTGSGKEAAQPEKDRGTLLGARVAPDWLENAERVRARQERSLDRAPDRSNPLPSRRLVFLAPRGSSRSRRAALPRGRGKDSASWASLPSPGARAARPSENTRAPGSDLESSMVAQQWPLSPPWMKGVILSRLTFPLASLVCSHCRRISASPVL